MGISIRCAAAIVAALALAGCGPEEDPTTGSISVVITGAGAGLGLTGNLIVTVLDEGLFQVAYDNSLYAQTLVEGVPLHVPAFTGLSPGVYWVQAFLDRDGNLTPSGGDVCAPGLLSYPGYYPGYVEAGEDTLIVVTLNQVP